MINTPASGLELSMESVGEGEAQNILGDDDNLDEMDDDDDDDDNEEEIIILDDEELERQIEEEMADRALPDEVNEYLQSLQAQTHQLEGELQECDDLLHHTGTIQEDGTVMVYGEDQELEKEARAQGLSVEAFRQKLLEAATGDDFTKDEMDQEFEELVILQAELAQIRTETASVLAQRPLIPEFKSDSPTSQEVLALEAPPNEETSQVIDTDQQHPTNPDVGIDKEEGAMALVNATSGELVSSDVLSGMRAFIQEQLWATDQWYSSRKQHLEQSIETLREEEEKRTEREEERKKALLERLEEEERSLMERKEEWEKRLNLDLRARDEQVLVELASQQAEITRVTEALEEEKQQYESIRKEIAQQTLTKKRKAATQIQKVYRGYRTRKAMSGTVAELDDLREVRKKERHQLRVMEIEYEIKYREEQAQKEKEELDKKEKEERIRKEEEEKAKECERERLQEEERKKEEIRKEEERKLEEQRLEEERKKKELEEQKKEEERKRKEEEKRLKEEEKKRKEEEKKRQKEEEKRRKEEEKKRLEEEKKRQKQEEKTRKDEEKLKKDEEKQLAEEKKRENEAEEKQSKEEENGKEKAKSTSDIGVVSPSVSNTNTNVADCDPITNTVSNHVDTSSASNGKMSNPSGPASNVATSSGTIQTDLEDGTKNDKTASSTSFDSSNNDRTELEQKEKLATNGSIENEFGEKPRTAAQIVDEKTGEVVSSQDFSLASHSLPVQPGMKYTPQPPTHPPPQRSTPPPSLASTAREIKPTKPDPVESLRLAWMGACLPWSKVSNEPWKLKPTTQKPHKRPRSAKKLSPIDTDVILTAAQAHSLREVSSVKLSELPGCSLTTLGQCWSLRYLTITHSGLTALEGISQCRHLLYINAEHNQIEYMDISNLGSVQVLSLGHNKLSVIHGLDGCINLRWLDLSNNRITRFGGLNSLRRLHTLNMSHNQLVSAEGLGDLVTVQQLYVAHNYLQATPNLDKMCLLSELDVSANNLQQVPELRNQVLLRRLNLEGNSLSSIKGLAQCWLPLLCHLKVAHNMLEDVTGIQSLILLSHLDIAHNQITDLSVLTSDLPVTPRLTHLRVEGNPVVEVDTDQYRTTIQHARPSLNCIDGQTLPPPGVADPGVEDSNPEFVAMCQKQVKVQSALWERFTSQIQSVESDSHVTPDTLCSIMFNFCDTSFKVASEHRAAHEYGDLSVTESLGQFADAVQTSSVLTDKKAKFDSTLAHNNASSVLDIKSKFDSALSSQPRGTPRSSISSSIASPPTSHSSNAKTDPQLPFNKLMNRTADKDTVLVHKTEDIMNMNSQNTKKTSVPNIPSGHKSKNFSEICDSSDSEEGVDVTDFQGVEKVGMAHSTPLQSGKLNAPVSYMNEKDKFELALQGGSSEANTNNSHVANTHTKGESCHHKGLFEQALSAQGEGHSGVSAKDKFMAALQENDATKSDMRRRVTADMVGHQLTGHGDSMDELDFSSLGVDLDLDGLDFDIDKYLDMGELDEFLQKGWRPEETPQFPQSSYPVLGKINPSDNPLVQKGFNTHPSHPSTLPTPPPPPTQAWREGQQVPELRGLPPRPSPLPGPSPSPSSVASAAETLGGGSVKSKREELTQEWGFKDERTAELMMARARKMKYNAERKRKLSKLNPQQRYQLFRRLEESGKIPQVRPPPAKVLPRKEYFQAREEEVQRQEYERCSENQNRVHRTFEWLHTQVGDYNVSSSRINPGPVLYANADVDPSRRNAYFPEEVHTRQISPNSDLMDSVSMTGGSKVGQGRRFSSGEAYNSQTPTLPPIQIGSAPSSHKGERISWRDNPVDKSGGWGGGKKRKSGAKK